MFYKFCCSVLLLFMVSVISVQSAFDKLEGEPCESQGVPGKCVRLYMCLSAYIDVKKKIHPKICSFRGREPIVCCTDCESVKDAREGYRRKKTREGGVSTVVVGGADAKRYNFTHMALLGYGKDRLSAQWHCGGSLISEKFILTAGHCTSDPKIVTYNKAVFPACLNVQGKFFKDYDEEEPVISFEMLHILNEGPVEDQQEAVATGWGKLGKNRELADTLQEVYLKRFSEKQCKKHFKPHRHLKHGYNATTQMCYGDEKEPKDTCEGDSGGPLQVRSQVAQCLHTVIGVTSFGRACGFAGDAGMYSRVYHYVDWIESVVWPGED
ncbi:hypothetical protein PYW07_013111 [Mythimna separata]|uniref:Peptidase S1 domain-containing protein n=1 Tax=Mythimna separata TaxID=271217 RepID=A0AAD7Y5P8_MYTSE|nr:hypothetical protein PYW07_013111 [Mythimna separata]